MFAGRREEIFPVAAYSQAGFRQYRICRAAFTARGGRLVSHYREAPVGVLPCFVPYRQGTGEELFSICRQEMSWKRRTVDL